MRETKVEKELVKGVTALGGTCEKFTTPGKVGPPDRLISWPQGEFGSYADLRYGRDGIEFVETKAPDGVLKSWQARDHARRRALGYSVHVLWNLEQVAQYLMARGQDHLKATK
jgi:hypothetical protein